MFLSRLFAISIAGNVEQIWELNYEMLHFSVYTTNLVVELCFLKEISCRFTE